MNFTKEELIHYLDLPSKKEKHIKVQLRGDDDFISLGIKDFESVFKVHYLPTLKFDSYEFLQKTVKNCPYLLRNRWTGGENLEMGERYRDEVARGEVADVSIRWIDESYGYGLFAEASLSKGTFIGEYAGLVRRLSRLKRDQNGYCFHYPTRFWSWSYLVVDAMLEGNELRFANHSDEPSMEPFCMVDRDLLHLIFFAKKDLHPNDQLTFHYGQDYWIKRKKLK